MAGSEAIKKDVIQAAIEAAKAMVVTITELNDKGIINATSSRQDTMGENTTARVGGLCLGQLIFNWTVKYKHTEVRHLN